MGWLLLIALVWMLVSVIAAFETGWFLRRVRRLQPRPRSEAAIDGSGSRT